MKWSGLKISVVAGLAALAACSARKAPPQEPPIAIVIHGGAGTIRRDAMTPDVERAYRAKLEEALSAGHRILKDGGSSLDAVEGAIVILEDSPLFNAGKGAVFTAQGTHELDASIMDGRTLNAGAVAAVRRTRNPIRLARLVMEKSPHVLLSGGGADAFARGQGLEEAPAEYFYTERRWKALQEKMKKEGGASPPRECGTVGAVALDRHGHLAAGTSTGGLTGKQFGRIGDSPIIGAGTYADNRTCAVSCTGHGEYFIRLAVAHRISALMAYGGLSVKEATERVVMKDLLELGGRGGVIALTAEGGVAMSFNTEGMYRGHMGPDGKAVIRIFRQ